MASLIDRTVGADDVGTGVGQADHTDQQRVEVVLFVSDCLAHARRNPRVVTRSGAASPCAFGHPGQHGQLMFHAWAGSDRFRPGNRRNRTASARSGRRDRPSAVASAPSVSFNLVGSIFCNTIESCSKDGVDLDGDVAGIEHLTGLQPSSTDLPVALRSTNLEPNTVVDADVHSDVGRDDVHVVRVHRQVQRGAAIRQGLRSTGTRTTCAPCSFTFASAAFMDETCPFRTAR